MNASLAARKFSVKPGEALVGGPGRPSSNRVVHKTGRVARIVGPKQIRYARIAGVTCQSNLMMFGQNIEPGRAANKGGSAQGRPKIMRWSEVLRECKWGTPIGLEEEVGTA